jgi:hypothetical protein
MDEAKEKKHEESEHTLARASRKGIKKRSQRRQMHGS